MPTADNLVDEVLDAPMAFGVGHLGRLMHQCHLLWGGVELGYGAQDGASQPEGVDLDVKCLSVYGRDLLQGHVVVQHRADGGQRQSEIA